MKKVILLLLLTGGMHQLKAQQLLGIKPQNNLADTLRNYFKGGDSPNYLSPKLNFPLNDQKLAFVDQLNSNTIYSTMPVAQLQATDRMPIVKTDEPGMKYTMLVKRIQVVSPLFAKAAPQPAP